MDTATMALLIADGSQRLADSAEGALFVEASGTPLTIAGTCSDLLLALWGRQLVGDASVAIALAAINLS